ncbi:MAG: hypothetical protein ABI621_13615 [Chloroflexota bacterium]
MTRLSSLLTLSSTRTALSLSKWTADPLTAGIDLPPRLGADTLSGTRESASQHMQVLRTHTS